MYTRLSEMHLGREGGAEVERQTSTMAGLQKDRPQRRREKRELAEKHRNIYSIDREKENGTFAKLEEMTSVIQMNPTVRGTGCVPEELCVPHTSSARSHVVDLLAADT